MTLELHTNVKLKAEPQAPEDLVNVKWVQEHTVAEDPGVWVRGEPGIYVRGTDFDIPGVTFQQFLDAHVNGKYFLGSITIDAGDVTRGTAVTIRNVYMQNQTLDIISNAQFAGTLILSGIFGALRIRGDWGTTLFSTAMNVQNVLGALTIAGSGATNRFNSCDFANCPDIRIDAGSTSTVQMARLQLVSSSAVLQGQGQYSFTRTNIRSGSRLEIDSSLGATAVNLGATPADPIERHGFILDYRRPSRPLETFSRREDITPTVWGYVTGTLANQIDLQTALNAKQATLIGTQVTGQNIKTVNGTTLLGTGNLVVDTSLPIAFVFGGVPAVSSMINVPITVDLTIPASLAGSKYYNAINPTSTSTFTLTRRYGTNFASSTTIGSVSVNTSGVASFSGAGSSVLAAGDVLRMTATTVGGDLTDVGITIHATRR